MVFRKDRLLWVIFAVLAGSTAVTGREIVGLFLLGGLTAYIFTAMPITKPWRAAAVVPVFGMAVAVRSKVLELLFFFTKAGAFVFGSGLAIIPFLYSGVVEQRHWLTDGRFLDAVAIAMITPGPVVITSGFIGYLVAGTWGALAAAAGVFVPVYLGCSLRQPVLQQNCQEPSSACVPARSDRRCDRRACRFGIYSGPACSP